MLPPCCKNKSTIEVANPGNQKLREIFMSSWCDEFRGFLLSGCEVDLELMRLQPCNKPAKKQGWTEGTN